MDYILVIVIVLSGPAPKQVATDVIAFRTEKECERNLATMMAALKLHIKKPATVLAGCYKEPITDKEA